MIRKGLRRIRRRFGGSTEAATASVGAVYSPQHEGHFAALAASAEETFERLGQVVASLPAPAAEQVQAGLARGLRRIRTAVRKGTAAAGQSGQLGHATAPLAAAFREVAVELEGAWTDAVALGAPSSGIESLAVFRDAAGRFSGAMARLPQSEDMALALQNALKGWEGMVVSGLERAVVGERGLDET